MNADRLLALYEQVAEAPDAVARLRRFVLDLAVRGKLVPQETGDEPASELLKRIAAEKARLVKAGEIKVRKLNARERDEPLDFMLPTGWALTELGDVSLKITDGAHKTPTYVEEGVPFVSVKDFSGGKLSLANTRFIPDGEHKVLYQRCDPRRGDILLGRIGTLGKAVLVDTDVEFSLFVSVGLIRFDHENLLPEFFRLLLNSPLVEREFDRIKIGGGTHTNKLNLGDLHTVAFLLPPLAEQRRIVAKVEELMALLDRLEAARNAREATRDRLTAASLARLTAPDPEASSGKVGTGFASDDATDKTPAESPANARFALATLPALTARPDQIKPLRQTILNLAVRGKLVEQDPTDEPSLSALKGIKAVDMSDEAFALPSSWAWVNVDAVANTRLGKMLDKAKNKGSPRPYLRNINVRWFDFDLSNLLEMAFEDSELEEFSLRRGDVLICEGGEPGRAAVWDERADGIYFQKAIHRVRFAEPVDPHFFLVCLKASADDGRLAERFTGTGIKHFTGKGLRSYQFPLPPLAEQHRIVARVDALMALCDRLEAALTTADTTRARLLEALLHEALEPGNAALEAAE